MTFSLPIMLPTSTDDESYRSRLTDEDRFTLASLYPPGPVQANRLRSDGVSGPARICPASCDRPALGAATAKRTAR